MGIFFNLVNVMLNALWDTCQIYLQKLVLSDMPSVHHELIAPILIAQLAIVDISLSKTGVMMYVLTATMVTLVLVPELNDMKLAQYDMEVQEMNAPNETNHSSLLILVHSTCNKVSCIKGYYMDANTLECFPWDIGWNNCAYPNNHYWLECDSIYKEISPGTCTHCNDVPGFKINEFWRMQRNLRRWTL